MPLTFYPRVSGLRRYFDFLVEKHNLVDLIEARYESLSEPGEFEAITTSKERYMMAFEYVVEKLLTEDEPLPEVV